MDEIASLATTPAITNAIYNATSIRVYDLPVDQDWMLRQLRERKNADSSDGRILIRKSERSAF